MRQTLSRTLSALIVATSLLSLTARAEGKAAPMPLKARNARKVLKTSVATGATGAPVSPNASRETSIRRLGVAAIVFRKDASFSKTQLDQLTARVVNDLSAQSYVQAVSVANLTYQTARRDLIKEMAALRVDGIVFCVISNEGFSGLILSRSGVRLASFSGLHDINLENEVQIKAAARLIVDETARAIPYRGFITRQTGDNAFEVNLGKAQGLIEGQRFRIFDFAASSFASEHQDMGEVRVVSVGENSAILEPTGTPGALKPFMKIGFNESAHGMAVAQQIETRGYVAVGAGLLNISGTGDPKYVDQAYNISSTPAFILRGGWNKFDLDLSFLQARGDSSDLVDIEGIATAQVYELAFGGYNRFSILAGGRVARVSITNKNMTISPLNSTTSISPVVEARFNRVIKGPVGAYVAANAYYPIYVTGIETGALLFSAGFGGSVGLSLEISPRLFLDVGTHYHLIRRPVNGQSSVQETYSELFAALGFRL